MTLLPIRPFLALLGACLAVACGTQTGPEAKESTPDAAGIAPLVQRAQRAAAAGDHDVAIDAYEEALERTPWNTRLERLLAVAHADRAAQRRADGGRAGLRDAERDLRRAIELDGDDETFQRNLGVVLIDRAAYESEPGVAAELRAEGARLAPDQAPRTAPLQLGVERRLDLAYELLERGQRDVGILRLESLHRDYPERADVTRLLAQAYVGRGGDYADRLDLGRAGTAFDRAVALYAEILPCDGMRCGERELRTAHRNRVVNLLNADRWDEARAALEEAESAGLHFPSLRAELPAASP